MSSLTVDALRKAQALLAGRVSIERFSLYPHDLPDLEACYILDVAKTGLMPDCGRKLLVVPRVRLIDIYQQMRAAGVDVLLEPRFGANPPPDAQEELRIKIPY